MLSYIAERLVQHITTTARYVSMSIIARAAYFKICPECGDHGRIFLSDGRKTSQILSKEAGMANVNILLETKQISEEEASALKQQIGDAADLREEVSILDLMQNLAEGMVFFAEDSEDSESIRHEDFFFGHKDHHQQKSQTMH